MEAIPRISRAQAMDALSSQSTVAGYEAALIAASLSLRFLPMLTTAAGTIPPARVLVLGVGVAGLQRSPRPAASVRAPPATTCDRTWPSKSARSAPNGWTSASSPPATAATPAH